MIIGELKLISNRLGAFMNSDNTVIKVWEHNHNINYENDNNDKIVYIIMEIHMPKIFRNCDSTDFVRGVSRW